MVPVPKTNNGAGMNMATWVSIWEKWADAMMKQGYRPEDLPKIASDSGEIFPKTLSATIAAKNTLFPDANMLYEYDLTNHKRRSKPHDSLEGKKGPGEWEDMLPQEIQSANAYYAWREDPKNASMIDGQFGGNGYAAYLASQGGKNGATSYGGVSSSSSGGGGKGVTGWFVQTPDGKIITKEAFNKLPQFNGDLSTALSHGYKSLKGYTFYPKGDGTFSATSVGGGDVSSSDTTSNEGDLANSEAMQALLVKLGQGVDVDLSTQKLGLGNLLSGLYSGVPMENYLSDVYGDILGHKFPHRSDKFGALQDEWSSTWGNGIPTQVITGEDGTVCDCSISHLEGSKCKVICDANPDPNGDPNSDKECQKNCGAHTDPRDPCYKACNSFDPGGGGKGGACDCMATNYPVGDPCYDKCNEGGGGHGGDDKGGRGDGDGQKTPAPSTQAGTEAAPAGAINYQLPGASTSGALAPSAAQAADGAYNPGDTKTWGFLSVPAQAIAKDTDAAKANIMKNLPAGGERNRALSDATISGYGNLAGLRQGLVENALTGVQGLAAGRMGTQGPGQSGSGSLLANIWGNNQQYQLGLRQLQAQQSNASKSMWGSILGSIGNGIFSNLFKSDVAVKENVRPFKRGLSDLAKIRPVSYRYTPEAGEDYSGTAGISVLAHELEEAIPEIVVDGPKHKSIAPMGLLMTAINSIQQLDKKVKKLEREKKK